MAKKKILIVDDEIELVKAIRIRLEQADYEVLVAYDGEKGLEKAKQYKPDLIILDILMSKIMGSDLAAILKMDEQLSRIPIIFLTCLAEGVVDKQRGDTIAGVRFMAKPFETEELLLAIDEVIQKAKGRG
ncbi:MAG: response regulator [Candidatus Omnitrophica bacterium]|nr:response regulator [Candidatus Omnitrophota bacterium]